MYVANNTPVVDNYYWNTPASSPFYTLPQPLHLPNVTVGGFYGVQTVRDGCMSPVALSLITFLPSMYASASVTADGDIYPTYTEMTFTAHISNGGGTPTVQWYRNGAPIQNANDTIYKGLLFSDVFPMDWLYVRVQRDSACGGVSYSDTAYVNQVLKVADASQLNDIALYPNPNNGTFFLQSPMLGGVATIEIVNAIGQRLFSMEASNTDQLEINLPLEITNGMYQLRLTNGEQTQVARFMLNR
jgi:hypothetical protein